MERSMGQVREPRRLVTDFAGHLALVWVLLGMDALAIVATYARVSPAKLYHVHRDGLAGGLGRALVFADFPVAFIAIAVIGVAVLRLRRVPSRTGQRLIPALALVGTVLCAVAAVPGVVEQDDLDAKAVNAVPALGVSIALGLSLAAMTACQVTAAMSWTRRDTIALALLTPATVVAIPWMLAEIGVFAGDVPLLGRLVMSKEISGAEALPAVHLGHHHGLDGWLFLISAIVLGRTLRPFGGTRAGLLRGYLSFMAVYGLANLVNDTWTEQVVKRGWSDWRMPSFLRPAASPAWGLIAIGAVIAFVVWFRHGDPPRPPVHQGGARVRFDADPSGRRS
jgi:hypothetical protein